jgi:transcriptional regulator with XRE-family HTH domain
MVQKKKPQTRSNSEPSRPAEIVARRIVEAREARGWKQAELAERLEEVGYLKSRSTVTKLEGGRYRGISIDDVFAFAAALGVSPVHLLTPLEDEVIVAVTPSVHLPAAHARAWIRGGYFPPMLPGVDLGQIPEAELRLAVEQWLEQKVGGPLARALMEEEFPAAVSRHVELLRNPPKQEEDEHG